MTGSPGGELRRNELLIGDVRTQLPTIPDDSVDCIITSPPYFGLRDYGHTAQLGLEKDVNAWVENLRQVGQDLARVLKPTGALWLNVGDGYSAHPREGTTKKGLLLGPQRLAIALNKDGWIIRNQVVWAKTSYMPSSVNDRLSNRYEVLLLLVRSPRYYFDLNAIRVPALTTNLRAYKPRQAEYPPQGTSPADVDLNRGLSRLKANGQAAHPLGKNPTDVWECSTASYHNPHFATFPERLITPALLATCPERVCRRCGLAWLRAKQRLHDRLLAVGELQPACSCDNADWQPGIVLDPFMGAGTTAVVAEAYQRDWLGIELNPRYAAMAAERIAKARKSPKRNTA